MFVGDISPLTYVQKHAPNNSYEVIYISWKNSGELWETVTYTSQPSFLRKLKLLRNL